MTRKDYQKIAQVLSVTTRHLLTPTDYRYLQISMGNIMVEDNRQFDWDKWHEACDKEYRLGGL